jgi:hypothetical protein
MTLRIYWASWLKLLQRLDKVMHGGSAVQHDSAHTGAGHDDAVKDLAKLHGAGKTLGYGSRFGKAAVRHSRVHGGRRLVRGGGEAMFQRGWDSSASNVTGVG